MDEANEEVLSNYSEDVLNYLSDMDDNEKANFLHHMEKYAENDDKKIELSKLVNGEYIPKMVSNKNSRLENLKRSAFVSTFFSIWCGISIANEDEIVELMSNYSNYSVRQILLAADQVLPTACAISTIFLTLDYWYHYSMCSDTLDKYQRLLKK